MIYAVKLECLKGTQMVKKRSNGNSDIRDSIDTLGFYLCVCVCDWIRLRLHFFYKRMSIGGG